MRYDDVDEQGAYDAPRSPTYDYDRRRGPRDDRAPPSSARSRGHDEPTREGHDGYRGGRGWGDDRRRSDWDDRRRSDRDDRRRGDWDDRRRGDWDDRRRSDWRERSPGRDRYHKDDRRDRRPDDRNDTREARSRWDRRDDRRDPVPEPRTEREKETPKGPDPDAAPEELDADQIAAMMGFGNFGTSKVCRRTDAGKTCRRQCRGLCRGAQGTQLAPVHEPVRRFPNNSKGGFNRPLDKV